ncbi:MAG: hypothetical protein WEB05_02935 [Solirubrobacterales bacterium]
MFELYMALGLAVIAANLITGLIGGLAWRAERISIAFWYLLRIAQAATLVFVLLEAFLYFDGRRAEDDLHYLYVALPVVASLLAEAMRGASASQELGETDFTRLDDARQQEVALAIVRRETAVMSVACFVLAFLVWRAIETTTGIF